MNTQTSSSQMTTIKMFNGKMVLSTGKGSKNILLWAENSGTIAFTYTDDNLKSFIPKDHLLVIGKELYSEYFIYLHENKSLFTIWSTDSTQFHSKFSVSDERISSIDLSSDSKLLSIATMTGMLYFYDLSIGFLLKSSQISKSEIYSIKQHNNFIYVLDKDRLSLFLIGKLFNTHSDTQPKEIKVYYQSDVVYTKILILSWSNTIVIWNLNQIMLLSLNDLCPIKTFRIGNKTIENLRVTFLSNIDIFFTSKNELFLLETGKYCIKETHQINYDDNSSMLLSDNAKGALTDITAFEFGTRKDSIITGHDDGKIRLWNRMKNKLYSVEGMYNNIHKGPVMNIMIINKPISQYGLNYNKAVKENIISKTQVKDPIDIPIKLQPKYDNYLKDMVDSYINNVIEGEMGKIILNEGAHSKINRGSENEIIQSSNASISKINKYINAYIN